MPIYLCGFCNGYSTQHALMRLFEQCREFLDKNGHAGALLMHLSKTLDCLDHDLLLSPMPTVLAVVHLHSFMAT